MAYQQAQLTHKSHPDVVRPPVIGAVFMETLRRQFRPTLYWGIGFAAMAFMVLAIIPDAEFFKLYQQVASALGGFFEGFLGADAAYAATPEGYVSAEFFSWIIFLLVIYAVIAGIRITITDEEDGNLDLVLSLPLPRWQLIVEQFLAYIVLIGVICILAFLGLLSGQLAVDALSVSLFRLFEAALNFMPFAIVVLAMTLFLSTVMRRRSMVTRFASILVVGAYILEFFGRMAGEQSIVHQVSKFSFYHYYDPVAVMQFGWQWGNAGLLLLSSVVLVLLAIWFFNRRDIAV